MQAEGGSLDAGGGTSKEVGAGLEGLASGERGVTVAGLEGGGTQGCGRTRYATPLEQGCNARPTKMYATNVNQRVLLACTHTTLTRVHTYIHCTHTYPEVHLGFWMSKTLLNYKVM